MLAIENCKDVFRTVARLKNGESEKTLGDVLSKVVINAKTAADYEYIGRILSKYTTFDVGML